MKYRIRVYETVVRTCSYVVEAPDSEEALELAVIGETESETTLAEEVQRRDAGRGDVEMIL